jgi:hypothetical protein
MDEQFFVYSYIYHDAVFQRLFLSRSLHFSSVKGAVEMMVKKKQSFPTLHYLLQ